MFWALAKRFVPEYVKEKVRPILNRLRGNIREDRVIHSSEYWEDRYRSGGNSGVGSYGRCATFKADVMNGIVQSSPYRSFMEFGCGDGNQLSLISYPEYIGLDVSEKALALCQEKYRLDQTKKFQHYRTGEFVERGGRDIVDCSLSLEVVFHLVEDDTYLAYLRDLFCVSKHCVVIFSSNENKDSEAGHVKHRCFTDWVYENEPEWELTRKILHPRPMSQFGEDGSFSDFYIYNRVKETRTAR